MARTFVLTLSSYIIVYSLVRRRVWLTVGLCPLHRRNRARAIVLGWLTALAGMVFDMGKMSGFFQPIALIAGVALFLGGIIGGAVGSLVLVP